MKIRRPTTEDRLRERQRPTGHPAMYQSWRRLLFLHWQIDPAEVQSRLPAGLHPDLHDGRAYLGVVPFFMCGVHPRGLPTVPGLSNFLELNVRTYVHDDHGVPGVWFFSLDASNRIACAIARSRFHLPYYHASMSATDAEWIDYEATRDRQADRARYRYRGVGQGQPVQPDTLEFFLVERYVLFAHDRRRERILRGQVHHAPYLVQDAEVEEYSLAPLHWDGLTLPDERPVHQCYARDVAVEIFSLQSPDKPA